jgi:predicted HicB family RNase H-like nuclease
MPQISEDDRKDCTFTLRIPRSLRNKISTEAKEQNRSVASLIRMCLERNFDKKGRKAANV